MSLFNILFRSKVESLIANENTSGLLKWLQVNSVLVPSRPLRMLNASNFTSDDLLLLISEEAEKMKNIEEDGFIPWTLGEKRLPIFTDSKYSKIFASRTSTELGKVFCSGSIKINVFETGIINDVSLLSINPFSNFNIELHFSHDART